MAGILLLGQPQGAAVKAEAGSLTVEISDATLEVHRVPFSEAGMAERFIADPLFYRNLAAFLASELRRQTDIADGQGNCGLVIKGQLTELAEGFENIATVLTPHEGILTPQTAGQAALIITNLRDAFAAFSEDHPELCQLAVIGLAGYALHQFGGVTADIGALISFAVVKKEKLSDIFSSCEPPVTGDQSRALNGGDRVCWHADKNDQGTVIETNWAGVTVKWDNRSEQAILHNDMAYVERVPTKTI